MAPPNFDRWIDREPRLSLLVSTARRVGCTDQQIMSMMAVLAFVLEDGKGPLAVTSAELAAAITPAPAPAPALAPAPVATAPMPASTAPKPALEVLTPARPEPPKQRKPFEKALETVCAGAPGLGRPWSLPEKDTPAQADAPPKPSRWDRALRTVCGSPGPWSMPDGAGA